MEFQKNKKKWSPAIETMVVLLKPTLAYSAGRIKEVRKFKEFIEPYIDSILNEENKEENLAKFFSLIESFIAYHKFYGG
jgi:CRISPR-associated protein Csm2